MKSKSIIRCITAALLSCCIYQTTSPLLLVNERPKNKHVILINDQQTVIFDGTLQPGDIAYVPLEEPMDYADIVVENLKKRAQTTSGEYITDNHVIYLEAEKVYYDWGDVEWGNETREPESIKVFSNGNAGVDARTLIGEINLGNKSSKIFGGADRVVLKTDHGVFSIFTYDKRLIDTVTGTHPLTFSALRKSVTPAFGVRVFKPIYIAKDSKINYLDRPFFVEKRVKNSLTEELSMATTNLSDIIF